MATLIKVKAATTNSPNALYNDTLINMDNVLSIDALPSGVSCINFVISTAQSKRFVKESLDELLALAKEAQDNVDTVSDSMSDSAPYPQHPDCEPEESM